jgi:hypothetical protein
MKDGAGNDSLDGTIEFDLEVEEDHVRGSGVNDSIAQYLSQFCEWGFFGCFPLFMGDGTY